MYISTSKKEPYAEEPRGGDKQSRHFKLFGQAQKVNRLSGVVRFV